MGIAAGVAGVTDQCRSTVQGAADKDITVTIPEGDEAEAQEEGEHPELRESTKIQALLVEIGAWMGMQI